MTDVPAGFMDLFEKKGFAHLAKGRPKVSLSIQDPDNPYRYLEARRTVVNITEEEGDLSDSAGQILGIQLNQF